MWKAFRCDILVSPVLFLAVVSDAWADPNPAIVKCQAALQQEDVATSVVACNEAVHSVLTDREKAIALNLRAIALLGKGDVDGAIADLNASIAADVPDAAVFSDRASLLLNKGEYDQAFRDYDEAILRLPSNGKVFVARAWAYLKRGNDEKALADFEKASTLLEDDPDEMTGRAAALFALGRFEESAQILRDMAERWMQPDMVLWTLAAEWRAGNLTGYSAQTAEAYLNAGEWPRPVAEYLTGSMTVEELKHAALAAPVQVKGPSPDCQVAFYTGETSLSLHQDDAKSLLLEAVRLCRSSTFEHMMAEAELKRMTP
jgi:Flp pilus assembly protein TadD